LVLEIFRFFEKHVQNTPQNNSASWDLQMGFNSVFKWLTCAEQCLSAFPQCAIYFTNLSHLVPEIFMYFKKCLQNLNALAVKL